MRPSTVDFRDIKFGDIIQGKRYKNAQSRMYLVGHRYDCGDVDEWMLTDLEKDEVQFANLENWWIYYLKSPYRD